MADTPSRWLKGTLTGTCVGKPTRKRGGSGLARWYQLELIEAVISDWQAVAGPPKEAPQGEAPFCQAILEDARLRSRTPGGRDEALAVRELSVWNWKMRDQREADGQSRCTLSGTVYAQEVEGTRRPAPLEGEETLSGWGCLAVLLGLLVASWLWWSCGPFTCGLWGSVVLASWWSHHLRTRRRTPPGHGSQLLQGLLGLALILGGVGLVIGMSDSSRVSTCDDSSSLAVVLAVAGVVGVSLLSVKWPLPWSWTLWTIVVLLWCGRSSTDCAQLWLIKAKDVLKGAPHESGPVLDDLFRPAPVRSSPSQSDGGEATGDADGGDGGNRRAGSGGTGSGGTGSGEPLHGGTGSGGTGSGAADATLAAQKEPRMSVEAALNDPKPFQDGAARVTLSGDLLFRFNEDKLKPEAGSRLEQVARLLRLDPARRVLLEGHSDSIGDEQYNQTLSERRAEAVRTWLVQQAHINPLQLDTMGFGSAHPLVRPSKDPTAQAANRRVEVISLH